MVFINSSTTNPIKIAETIPTVIIVDPISTGAVLAKEFAKAGCDLVRVNVANSQVFAGQNLSIYKHEFKFDDSLDFNAGVEKLATTIQGVVVGDIKACVAGCESGVEVAESLAMKLNLPTNNPNSSLYRREKYAMGEAVRAAGLRAVIQKKAKTWDEVEAFVHKMNPVPFKVVIKPLQSAGSDNVTLANSWKELRAGFDAILNKPNILGIVEDAVLVQECLQGTEYVVDTVSKNSVHKLLSVFEYDKRRANDRDFIYFGMKLMQADNPIMDILSRYIFKVLDALQFSNSPGHAEVKMTPTGPCLIEVGARPHGGNGSWTKMAGPAFGHTQLTAMVLSALDEENFYTIPPKPVANGFGHEFFFVSRKQGTLQALPLLHKVKQLSSFKDYKVICKVGQFLPLTENLLTVPMTVILFNMCKQQLEEDVAVLRHMEDNGFFLLESRGASLKNKEDCGMSIQMPNRQPVAK